MLATLEPEKLQEISHIEKISEIYKKRTTRKEFPASSFLHYVQMAVVL